MNHTAGPQLIAYADRFGGSLSALKDLLDGPLAGTFDGVHILPFFTPFDGEDAGFDPSDHTVVDSRLGTWEDVRDLAATYRIMADLIVNHVSASSPEFLDVIARGSDSPHFPMFLTMASVFPDGATEVDLAAIYRPRPGLPFTPMTLGEDRRLMWTTFTSQQIDLDVRSTEAAAYLERVLASLTEGGVSMVRLDAVGYSVKTPGTSSFMTPDTYAFIDNLAQKARARGAEVLVEIHGHYEQQIDVASKVDLVYDFALPPLVLYALHTGDAAPLLHWMKVRPTNAITVLDTHDGIGVVDVGPSHDGQPGLLDAEQIESLVEGIHERSRGGSRAATGWAASNVDVYQVNCTYFDALGGDEKAYLAARAFQLFTPGTPQIYYVGLLAGRNDMELLRSTGVGRNINRHHYDRAEIEEALGDPLVMTLMRLIRLRKNHPAFAGRCSVDGSGSRITLDWTHDNHRACLDVDFADSNVSLTATTPDGDEIVMGLTDDALGELADAEDSAVR
ncbi:sucrose phosphorylase [Flaviflexus huanghaiensis]|uniref:sucrose phosphorylase n=1 Tax=Flaviflexus huanghaiensis TaxID=1111473 RepID=UPI0015FD6CDF|nr:sucrose phosphorylase [Flaviflexus huanghaiensis]